jgi:hypothetical protein
MKRTKNTARHQFNNHLTERFRRLSQELRAVIVYDHYKSTIDAINIRLYNESLRLGLNHRAISENASCNYSPSGSNTYCSELMFCMVSGIERWSSPFQPDNMTALCAWADLPYDPLPMEEHDTMQASASTELSSLAEVSASTLRSIFRVNTSLRALIRDLDEKSPYYQKLLDAQDLTTTTARSRYPIPNLSRICTMFLCVTITGSAGAK